ncbi:MAG: hypothetical protein HY885_16515 [Deltaproteobacteria bacterium]|nr:hypothetical protein [Deltaproteobacteria bacterium]
MRSEEIDTTQRSRRLSADSGKPAGRMVRALLGLPENATGTLQGQGPVPPVAFRYHMQPPTGEPSPPWPLSSRTTDLPADDMESVSALPDGKEVDDKVMAPDHSPMVDLPSAGNGQRIATRPPAEKNAAKPTAANHPRSGGEEVPHHDRQQPRARVMTTMTPAVPAVSGAEKLRQPAKNSGQGAAGQKEATSGTREEMTIPGRSPARQLFPSLAQAQSDQPAFSDQPPAILQASLPLQAGRIGQEGAPPTKANRSEHLSQAEEHAQPPADRRVITRLPTPLPATTQAENIIGQQARAATAGKSAAHDSEAGNPAAPERQPAVATQQQREQTRRGEARAGERQPAVTPARQPDEDGVRRIEELRRTFYDLISKKTTATETVDHGQTSPAERETPPPPLQQIVVINRTSGSRNGDRLPAAFWERSYMARTTLKMIR